MTQEEYVQQQVQQAYPVVQEILKARNIESSDELVDAMLQAVINGRRLEAQGMAYRVITSGMQLALVFGAALCASIVIHTLAGSIEPKLAIVGLSIPLLFLMFLKLIDQPRRPQQ